MAAYWVVRVNVLDAKKLQAYAPLAAAAVTYGGRYLARGVHETTEGIDYARNVLVCWGYEHSAGCLPQPRISKGTRCSVQGRTVCL